jgi:hypothetical protein
MKMEKIHGLLIEIEDNLKRASMLQETLKDTIDIAKKNFHELTDLIYSDYEILDEE